MKSVEKQNLVLEGICLLDSPDENLKAGAFSGKLNFFSVAFLFSFSFLMQKKTKQKKRM